MNLLKRLVSVVLFLISHSVMAIDTFDGTNLIIPQVQVGTTTYANVKITIGSVLQLKGGAPKGNVDTYSNGQLSIQSVQALGSVYTNLVVTVGSIVSVGGVIGPNGGALLSAYASPNGNDSNPGTISQPFQSIQMCASSLATGGTCYVRAGRYLETIVPNSGTTITSYNNEVVIIDGSNPITSDTWKPYKGSIYRTPITLSSGDTNQVFVDQQMMTEARWPNSYDLLHPIWSTAQSGTTTSLLFDSNLPTTNIAGSKIKFWSGSDPWTPETADVLSSSNGSVVYKLDSTPNPPFITPQTGGLYYLFGHLNLLDSAQEWFYDSSNNFLYFWAPSNVNPSTLNVRVKQRFYAFDLSGKTNVTLKNLSIFSATITSDTSSSNNTVDGINASYISHFTTIPNHPVYTWPSGYQDTHVFDTGIVLHGSGNTIVNSKINFSACNGVVITNNNNTVRNNLISNINYMGNDCSGVYASGTGHVIKNNTIFNAGRSAIFPTPLWDPIYNPKSLSPSNIDISFNNLFNTAMLSSDVGAIYVGGSTVVGSSIHHNWLHDNQKISVRPYSPYADNNISGVYLDNGSNGWSVTQNVLWNNYFRSIFLNGDTDSPITPNNNLISNNSIIDIGVNSFLFMQNIAQCGTTSFTNNYVLVAPQQVGSTCPITNNSSSSLGASEMTSTTIVGCTLAGCSFNNPPTVINGQVTASIASQLYNITVNSGSTATFSTLGAGSGAVKYQWYKNGTIIPGANSPTFSINNTSTNDNGASFSVVVSNSINSVASNVAILTVQ
jgi:hypothetical protein